MSPLPAMILILTILRAWILAGVAIRGATALGMYMRNDSNNLQDSYKEIRYRVWWSLYTLEHRLCNMTGRINSIVEDHITTPLPLPYDEDDFGSTEASELLTKEKQQGERNPASSRSSSIISSNPVTERSNSLSKPDFSRTPSEQAELEWAKNVPPNGSLYFLHLVQLTRLTQGIFHKLYTPAAISGSWKHVQTVIDDLQRHLDDWYKALPVTFDFKRKQRDREFYEYRLGLGFFYYGTCITINRPTLCRLDRKMPRQSKESSEFNSGAAARCLEAAIDMLTLIPDEPNAIGLNRIGPFFSLLHWLMQACTVLMLELSFRVYHMPQEAENILEAATKAVRWIHSMGEENPSARRAWIFCNAMLRQAARKIGREVHDLPEQPPGRQPSMSSQGRSEGSRMSYQPQQGQQQHPSMFAGTPNFGVQQYASFDPLMQHDQYFPDDSGSQNQLHYGQTSATEMYFMSQSYLDGQDHEQVDGDISRFN
jgi:Fungal specific transcription factor domain